MIADVDLAGAAALVHRSTDRFAKVWRRLRDDHGFPSPFIGAGKGQRPWWRVADIEAWKAAQAARSVAVSIVTAADSPAQRQAEAEPANDPVARPPRRGDLVARLVAAAGE